MAIWGRPHRFPATTEPSLPRTSRLSGLSGMKYTPLMETPEKVMKWITGRPELPGSASPTAYQHSGVTASIPPIVSIWLN
jgi:hypothetical protein